MPELIVEVVSNESEKTMKKLQKWLTALEKTNNKVRKLLFVL